MARVLDLLPDFFYVHDYDLRFHYANQRAASYFGYASKDDVLGRTLLELDPSREQAQAITALCRQIMDGGVPRLTDNIEYVRSDGTRGVLRQHDIPFVNPKTGEKMLVGLSRDVTIERELADQRLRAAELHRELEIARRIQAMLRPTAVPGETSGLDLVGHCQPAAFAGGDFYDWVLGPAAGSLRAFVCLGDVTGHGVGAAILAASCRAYARVLAAVSPLTETMATLNAMLASDIKGGDFVTFAAASIDTTSGAAELVSAGHGPLLIRRRSGHVEELDTHCPPLGVLDELPTLTPHRFTLEPGDSLVIVSDGLYEWKNAGGEQFGTERLRRELARVSGSSSAVMHTLLDRAAAFAGDCPAHDDVTALVVGRPDGSGREPPRGSA